MFQRDGDWWDFCIGRLCISKRSTLFRKNTILEINEAPGCWYIELFDYQIAWKRAWIVWRDHPFKSRNIRFYDQFGTFRKGGE